MNEQDIPIDIHTAKLQEWLVSRRLVQKNFHIPLKDIRNKISLAINDMPAHDELVTLLSGAHINYFHCLRIIEILKTTEKDSKSVFGTYGSKRMKDWQEIVRLYEKDNLYLAEAAQILSRNIAYEVPGLKRQVVKFEQVCEESAKKIQDLTKSEHILVTEHATLCSQLGIKGDNLQQELTEKVKQLPQLQEQAANASTALKKAVNIYGTFTGNEKCLPILRHIIEKGNTTVYEYVKKEAPSSIEAPPIEIQLSPEYAGLSNQNQEIDFGDGGIDFGGDSAIDIDYGDISVEGGGDIDWGITDEPVDSSVASSDFIVAESGQDKGVARGNQALTILDSPVFKDQFIDELMELESFLQMRIFELNAIENSNTFSMLDSASTHDVATITNLLPDIDVVVEKLTNDLIQHLHQLKHSARYADILAEKLQQKLIAIEKNKATRVLLKEKIEELKVQREQTKPRIERMIEQTKILQDQIEKDISKKYKNRIVNLMGGVNSL